MGVLTPAVSSKKKYKVFNLITDYIKTSENLEFLYLSPVHCSVINEKNIKRTEKYV